jgi:hypothetical protein
MCACMCLEWTTSRSKNKKVKGNTPTPKKEEEKQIPPVHRLPSQVTHTFLLLTFTFAPVICLLQQQWGVTHVSLFYASHFFGQDEIGLRGISSNRYAKVSHRAKKKRKPIDKKHSSLISASFWRFRGTSVAGFRTPERGINNQTLVVLIQTAGVISSTVWHLSLVRGICHRPSSTLIPGVEAVVLFKVTVDKTCVQAWNWIHMECNNETYRNRSTRSKINMMSDYRQVQSHISSSSCHHPPHAPASSFHVKQDCCCCWILWGRKKRKSKRCHDLKLSKTTELFIAWQLIPFHQHMLKVALCFINKVAVSCSHSCLRMSDRMF